MLNLAVLSAFLLFCIVLNKETADIMLCWLVRHADLHFFFEKNEQKKNNRSVAGYVDMFCYSCLSGCVSLYMKCISKYGEISACLF